MNFKRNNTSISPRTYKLGALAAVVPALYLLAGMFSTGVVIATVVIVLLTVLSAWFDSETNN